jgi:hypothetical protein
MPALFITHRRDNCRSQRWHRGSGERDSEGVYGKCFQADHPRGPFCGRAQDSRLVERIVIFLDSAAGSFKRFSMVKISLRS